MEQILPTKNALVQHLKRAVNQGGHRWLRALLSRLGLDGPKWLENIVDNSFRQNLPQGGKVYVLGIVKSCVYDAKYIKQLWWKVKWLPLRPRDTFAIAPYLKMFRTPNCTTVPIFMLFMKKDGQITLHLAHSILTKCSMFCLLANLFLCPA